MFTFDPPLEAKVQCYSYRTQFTANLSGRKVQVFFSRDGSLWYFVSERDAEDYDERPGQHVVASNVWQAVEWIKFHTPAGKEQDQLLNILEWNHFPYFLRRQAERKAAETAAWEEKMRIERVEYAMFMERLMEDDHAKMELQREEQRLNLILAESQLEHPVTLEPSDEHRMEPVDQTRERTGGGGHAQRFALDWPAD